MRRIIEPLRADHAGADVVVAKGENFCRQGHELQVVQRDIATVASSGFLTVAPRCIGVPLHPRLVCTLVPC
jgi:hypothetical protein